MLDLLTSTAFDLAGQPVSWAEPLGFLTGLVTVALAVPQRVETFPVVHRQQRVLPRVVLGRPAVCGRGPAERLAAACSGIAEVLGT